MLTAAVAKAYLEDDVLLEAQELLTILKSAYPYSSTFISSAHWMDDLKADGIPHFNTWHYIDNLMDGDVTCPEKKVNGKNVIWALQTQTKVLNDPASSPLNRALALRYVMHLVGDLHMPLHTASRCTSAHPHGDKGGNHFILDHQYGNLHKLWDSMAGSYPKLDKLCPYPDIAACNRGEAERVAAVTKEAGQLVKMFPPESYGSALGMDEAGDIDFQQWANESNVLVVQGDVYGGLVEHQAPPGSYLKKVRFVTKRCVALGGYRLAIVLNTVLGGTDQTSGLSPSLSSTNIKWQMILAAALCFLVASV